MKKIILFLTFLSVLSCSIEKGCKTCNEEPVNGLNSLITTETLSPGEECRKGGFILNSGQDLNGNNVLDLDEVTSSEVVCDGVDGLNFLYDIEINDTNCSNGGLTIESGLDLNSNGQLDSDEVLNSNLLCNGKDGLNGVDGVDGQNGLTTLMSQESIDIGVFVHSGLDLNNDGVLEDSEITTTSFVSNGVDGEQGVQGETGNNGANGYSSLVETSVVESNSQFPNGAIKISTGLDVNNNGILDSSEITSVNYVENGSNGLDGINGSDGNDGVDGLNGYTSLINILNNTPNEDSTTIETGLDLNNNGVLEDSEVLNSAVVENGINGVDGSDGLNSLINTVTVEESTELPNGGVEIYTGLDVNNNGVLDADEVTNVEYLENGADGVNGSNGSDGQDGLTSLVSLEENTPEEGQTTVNVGIDLNNNGVLEDSEITNSTVIQDGLDGADGVDGQDGQNGKDGVCCFIKITDEEPGNNCTLGGKKIITGKDLNGNKELDQDEIKQVEYICIEDPCVELREVNYIYDFEEYSLGDIVSTHGAVEGYGYRADFQGNQLMIFDSNRVTGEDPDLMVNSGNILIISEDNDASDPDDLGASGGVMRFVFDEVVTFNSIDAIDIESNTTKIAFYDEQDNLITKEKVVVTGSKTLKTQDFNISEVKYAIITLGESGGFDNLSFSKEELVYTCN